MIFGKKYSIDYSGERFAYDGAEDYYRAGERVTLYYRMAATDTRYTFYLDSKQLLPDYDDSKGFIISFTMPDHDVALSCVTRNTMLPEEKSDDIQTRPR